MSEYWNKYWNSIDTNKRQKSVGRTKFGEPVNDAVFNKELEDIKKHLELNRDDIVLDLCCGNGLITEGIYSEVGKVIAIDFSQPLLEDFVVESDNIQLQCADLTQLDFEDQSYNKVIWYFAIQHFSLAEAALIIKNVLESLKKDGVLYIGDIPNLEKKWNFYSKEEYRYFYFDTLFNKRDHIGTWFQKDFFSYLLDYLGYNGKYVIVEKPEYHFNQGIRFDLIVKK